MNNKNFLIVIVIIVAIVIAIVAGIFLISSSSGEVVIDNVAGVDNVTLPGENFSKTGTIPGKGFSIITYKPLGKQIHFHDLNMSDTGFNNIITNSDISVNSVKSIAGINGTLNYYAEAKTLVFIFEVNNKLYSIDIMDINQDQVTEAENAINILLTAWLQSSGYKQTDNLNNNSTYNTTTSNSNNNNISSNNPPHGSSGHECDPGDSSCRAAYNNEHGYSEDYDGMDPDNYNYSYDSNIDSF